jgi:hypothetical protein
VSTKKAPHLNPKKAEKLNDILDQLMELEGELEDYKGFTPEFAQAVFRLRESTMWISSGFETLGYEAEEDEEDDDEGESDDEEEDESSDPKEAEPEKEN